MELKENYTGGFTQAESDKENRIVRGVAVITAVSANNRIYTEHALQQLAEMVSGSKVFIDLNQRAERSPEGRSIRDLLGGLANGRLEEQTVRADFAYVKTYAPLVESLVENPGWAAFSISALGVVRPGRTPETRTVVEEITRLNSCDIVTEGATCRSLFESLRPESVDGMFLDDIMQIRLDFDESMGLAQSTWRRKSRREMLASQEKLAESEIKRSFDDLFII